MNIAQRTRLAGAGAAVLLATAGIAGAAAPAAAAGTAVPASFLGCPPAAEGTAPRHGICLCVWFPLPPWWPPGCPTP
ncbi:hypothetical protein, partial [Streptomyces hainanensis]